MNVMPGAPGLAAFARPGSGYVRHRYCPFLRHFGSRVVDVVLAQVSQQRRDLAHPRWVARVAKLADARDLKSRVARGTYRFNSGPGHQIVERSSLCSGFGRRLPFVSASLAHAFSERKPHNKQMGRRYVTRIRVINALFPDLGKVHSSYYFIRYELTT